MRNDCVLSLSPYRPPSDLSCSSFSLSPHQIWLFSLLVLFYFILILILFCLKININLKNRFFFFKKNGNRKILDGTIGMKSKIFPEITPNSPLLFFHFLGNQFENLCFEILQDHIESFQNVRAKKKKFPQNICTENVILPLYFCKF